MRGQQVVSRLQAFDAPKPGPLLNPLISLVGAAGFEPATPSPPDWCANQAALRSEVGFRARLRTDRRGTNPGATAKAVIEPVPEAPARVKPARNPRLGVTHVARHACCTSRLSRVTHVAYRAARLSHVTRLGVTHVARHDYRTSRALASRLSPVTIIARHAGCA